MGLYLRKAFTFGPLRLNLSKSGVGVSAGIKGFRIGTGPRGAYLHAGRHGLYLREPLHLSAPTPEPREMPRPASPSASTEAPTATIGAGITLESGPTVYALRVHVKRYGVAFPMTCLIGGVLTLFAFLAGGLAAGIFSALGAAGLAGFIWAADSAYEERLNTYVNRLCTAFNLRPPLPQSAVSSILHLRAEGHFLSDHLLALHRFIYMTLLGWFMQDGKIEEQEKNTLERTKSLLGLSAEETQQAKVRAFQLHYLKVVSDHDLTEAEEQTLGHFRDVLQIPDHALEEELHTIAVLRKVREVRAGKGQPIEVEIKLQKEEVCYHRTTGQQLEKRVLRSYTINRERQKEEGLVPTKKGDLYITSKRLLLVGDGATSFPLDRILDVEVDADQNLLEVTVDGRKTPVYLTVPDALITGAHIEHLSR